MRVIITAAGGGSRWANHRGHRKHLLEIDGETLINRIVRLLKKNGVDDIYLVHHVDTPYQVNGAVSVPHVNYVSNALARLATQPLWSTTGKTLIILGDVWFTEEAIATMVKPVEGWNHYARLSPSIATGKPGAEMFGCQFGPEDHDIYVAGLKAAGLGTDWPAYCAMTGHDPQTPVEEIRDWGMHIDIPDDGTDDFDFPQDYYRFMKFMRPEVPVIKSCLRVRAEDYAQPWFTERRRELNLAPVLHRKLWENCTIAQVYHDRVKFEGRAIGFGVGRERLPAWLACHGVGVYATDRPAPGVWNDKQHARNLENITHEGICNREQRDAYIRYGSVDMRDIPDTPNEFDFSWSSSCFEHLGSVEAGLDFFCNQMKVLRKGGISAHTTEMNLEGPQLRTPDLVTFTLADFHRLADRLEDQGDRLWSLKPLVMGGNTAADRHVDRAPYGTPHLNIAIGPHVFTSVLLVAEKG